MCFLLHIKPGDLIIALIFIYGKKSFCRVFCRRSHIDIAFHLSDAFVFVHDFVGAAGCVVY